MRVREQLRPIKKIGPEQSPWFWTPDKGVGRKADPLFAKQLKELGEELAVSWNPIIERWQVWSRSPRINQKICQGWLLLFVVKGEDGSYRPLDERVLARLAAASVLEHGSGKAYFARVKAEMERDQEIADRDHDNERNDIADSWFNHQQIKVGYGKSSGSKFSDYLS